MQTPEAQIRLDLRIDEVNTLIAGLGKLPLEVSAELWMKIRQQAQDQVRAGSKEESAPGLTD